MSRFVRPETRTLVLKNGDSLIVRKRLTAGETRAHFARLFTVTADGTIRRNPLMSGVGVIVAYLLDWDFKDEAGRVVPIRDLGPDDLQTVIDSLDTFSFDEIKVAIETHEREMVAEREAEKKTDGGTA